jgi:hypothetical protein
MVLIPEFFSLIIISGSRDDARKLNITSGFCSIKFLTFSQIKLGSGVQVVIFAVRLLTVKGVYL